MKLLTQLLLAACAFGQPSVDSVFVFERENIAYTHAVSLPDGGYIMAGRNYGEWHTKWLISRLSADREVIWDQSTIQIGGDGIKSVVVTDQYLLIVGDEAIPIDSNSWTSHDIVVKFSLDGDSLWSRDYDDLVNYTSLAGAVEDGAGGYVLLGTEAILSNEVYNHQVRLTRIDAQGDEIWERFFGGEFTDSPGRIAKLEGDTLMFTALMDEGPNDHVAFIWTDMNGDSLMGRAFSSFPSTFAIYTPWLMRRGSGWEFIWNDWVGSSDEHDLIRWIRCDYFGNVELDISVLGEVNSFQGVRQTADGLLTVGYSPGFVPDMDIVIGRLNTGGAWYFQAPIEIPLFQFGYDFMPTVDGSVALLGNSYSESLTGHAVIYYLDENDFDSYLFALPPQLNFGIVPLHEEAIREIALVVTDDSSATISEILVPEFIASSLQFPVTIVAGETLHFVVAFRPDELRTYSDSIHIISDAANPDLPIAVSGEAPFPVCAPSIPGVNFFWVHVGDSVQRPLLVRNTGTIPLHIDEIVVPQPFYLDSSGPFVVEQDSAVLLSFTFRPDSVDEYRTNLILHSDDPQGADTVVLLGRGIIGQVHADDGLRLPREFKLHPAYPNPFNANAVLRFDLPMTEFVKLALFDITGRLVRNIADEPMQAGEHRILIDAAELPSGIYFANLTAGGHHAVQKLLLVK